MIKSDPIKEKYDVVVCGGGPAGIGASMAAARNGAEVLLLEGTNCLGGMLTNGLVNMIRTAGDTGGIISEFYSRCAEVDCCELTDRHPVIPPPVARVIYFRMLLESGVRILLHTLACGVTMDKDHITGIQFANKAGLQTVFCDRAIDCTGDGDIAAWAGAPFEKGRDKDGFLQAVSLLFSMNGVDTTCLPSREQLVADSAEALETGEIELIPPHLSVTKGQSKHGCPDGTVYYQCDLAHHIDASDPVSLTDGEMICHERVFRIWRFLKKRYPAYRNSRINNIATYLGIRETRRIRGIEKLREEDVISARKRPDGISRCSWYMDLHDGVHKTSEYRASLSVPDNDWYEIPYGCLVPMTIDNLLVAGRCISSTRLANGSLRLQPTCMNLGQAAGTAAAISLQRKITPRALKGEDVRNLLKEQGAAI